MKREEYDRKFRRNPLEASFIVVGPDGEEHAQTLPGSSLLVGSPGERVEVEQGPPIIIKHYDDAAAYDNEGQEGYLKELRRMGGTVRLIR